MRWGWEWGAEEARRPTSGPSSCTGSWWACSSSASSRACASQLYRRSTLDGCSGSTRLLPSTIVWTAHIPAALALFGLALAYPIYIRRAGLTRRIAPDAVRMRGHLSPRPTSLERDQHHPHVGDAPHAVAAACDGLADVSRLWRRSRHSAPVRHMDPSGERRGHIVAHLAIGGVNQLLRMFRPARLPASAPPLDPFDLLVTQQQSAARHPPQERRPADLQQQPRGRLSRPDHPGRMSCFKLTHWPSHSASGFSA